MKVNYSTLKGLFGNEDGVSRCRLVSMATELFLRSGSVEGALNTLRGEPPDLRTATIYAFGTRKSGVHCVCVCVCVVDNKWFLGSSLWPCEPTDVIERTNMLVCLAKKTSHRDTLEVLTNLPGLQEPTGQTHTHMSDSHPKSHVRCVCGYDPLPPSSVPSDVGSMSQYESLFNSHLSVCVERQTLPVAADTLDFMLSKSLAVEPPLLHTLLHKLGKQNVWLRARSLFKCASVPPI